MLRAEKRVSHFLSAGTGARSLLQILLRAYVVLKLKRISKVLKKHQVDDMMVRPCKNP